MRRCPARAKASWQRPPAACTASAALCHYCSTTASHLCHRLLCPAAYCQCAGFDQLYWSRPGHLIKDFFLMLENEQLLIFANNVKNSCNIPGPFRSLLVTDRRGRKFDPLLVQQLRKLCCGCIPDAFFDDLDQLVFCKNNVGRPALNFVYSLLASCTRYVIRRANLMSQ